MIRKMLSAAGALGGTLGLAGTAFAQAAAAASSAAPAAAASAAPAAAATPALIDLAKLAPAAQAVAQAGMMNKGDNAWMLVSSALVLMMSVPALALFYGGLVRTKNMLSVLMQVFMIISMAASRRPS